MKTGSLMLGGGAVVAVIALGAVLLRPDAPAPSPAVVAADLTTDAVPEQAVVASAVEGPEAEASPVPLKITDFRFEPDGALLLAGRAQPDVALAIMIDGQEAERGRAAADGSFVIAGFVGFSDAPRRLALIEDPDGAARTAERSFVLDANPAPMPEPTPEPAIIAEAPSQSVEAAEALPQETLPDVAPPAPSQPTTSTILAIAPEGVDVVQAPVAADAPPEVMATVALDSISYDAQGDVVLAGRAPSEGFVQVYIDNAPVSRLEVGADGSWRTDLPEVDKGVYTLRIDEVASDGAVVSRIETPFQREDPADLVAALQEQTQDPAFTVATRTVQPGVTLWAIAEERYGNGVQYLTVFEANRDRIRDPDLIYPGQVFVLPEQSN